VRVQGPRIRKHADGDEKEHGAQYQQPPSLGYLGAPWRRWGN
jgi:hypothetical protein